jgi:hypothetical protein
MNKIRFLVGVGLLALASSTRAANVTYSISYPTPTTWQVTAKASLGDNGGIASYGFVLTESKPGGITGLTHSSIRVAEIQVGSEFGPLGFTLLRSANGVANKNVGGSQDTATPTPFLIYGYGQTAGHFGDIIIPEDPKSWPAEPILANGTKTADTQIGIDVGNVLTLANVFTTAGSPATQAATVNLLIPEPSTCMLGSLAMIGLAVRRRSSGRLSRS